MPEKEKNVGLSHHDLTAVSFSDFRGGAQSHWRQQAHQPEARRPDPQAYRQDKLTWRTVKTGTIQTERYPGESDQKGSEWTDRDRQTILQNGAQLLVRLIWQSISLPKVLGRFRHNVCKELDLHAANFLQPAGDGQKAQSKTTKASPSGDLKGLTLPSPIPLSLPPLPP